MTAYTSAASGNWSTSTNWTPSGVPGNGDTVVVSGHNITVDSSRTIGTSGVAGTAALTVQSSGSLTVATGATLTLRGDLVNNNCAVNLSAGCIVEFDSSASAAPSSTSYGYRGGTGHNQASQVLNLNGTAGSRITIRSNAGGANGFLDDGTGPFLQGCQIAGNGFVNFENIGTASKNSITTSPTGSASFALRNARMTNCGRIGGTYNLGATCTYILENVTMTGTTHSTNSLRVENAGSYTSGTRSITGCVFDKNVSLYTGLGFVIGAENIFEGTLDATAGDWQSCTGSAFLDIDNTPPGTVTNSYFNAVGVTNNPHNLQPLASANVTYSGNVFDNHSATNAVEEGDCILDPLPGSTRTYTIEYNIVTPTANGRLGGSLCSLLGNSNVRINFNHNTGYITANNGASPHAGFFTVGETTNTATGQVLSCRSNIFSSNGSRNAYLLRNLAGTPNNDVVTAANLNYNVPFNMATGSEGRGYNTPVTGTPGANDLNVDPQFIDPTRNIATWDASLGGPGTQANAVAELKKRNSTGYNSAYTVAALIAYIKEGFRPTNSALENAGHDGITIGAMEGSFGDIVEIPTTTNNLSVGSIEVFVTDEKTVTIPAATILEYTPNPEGVTVQLQPAAAGPTTKRWGKRAIFVPRLRGNPWE